MIHSRNLFLFFIALISAHCFSQKQTNQWHFGTLAGIDFNSGAPVALTGSALNTNEGCSSASDASGNLLFYTDGVSVWDKTNTQMPNGNNLDGDISSTESALVVPVPGSATLYYIFTVDYVVGPKGFEYSIVDMTQNAGKGDVTTKNTLIQNNVTEKQAAVYHCNGTDIWVMVHEWNNNKFYAYLVTSSGINLPVISSVGTLHNGSSTNNSIGYMKFSNDGSRVACAIGYKDTVDVFDFDNKTGVVSNPVSLSFGINHVYGVEFSPDNSKLYVSYYEIGNAGWVSQFDLTASNVAASQTVLGTSFDPNYIYALQLASDGKIYCATEVTPWIGVINSPNTLGAGCNYVVQGFNVDPNANGYYCMLGLPNFIASYFYPGFPSIPACAALVGIFSISDTVLCKNDCISFTDQSTGGPPTSWQWSFPGANTTSSTAQDPTNICYSSAGTYTATLIVSDGTTTDTVTHTITVLSGPTANAGTNVTITIGSNTTLNATGGGTYAWSPSAGLSCTTCPNPVANPTITTTYSVTVTDSNGCTNTDSVTVYVTAKIIAAFQASDTLLCKNQCISFTDNSSGTPTNWQWSFPGASPAASTAQNPLNICYSSAGNYTVTLIASNTLSSDTIIHSITVAPGPTANAGTDITITIGSNTTLNASGGGTYSWNPSTGLSCINCPDPIAAPNLTTTYFVTVTDANGCTSVALVTVFVEPPSVSCFEPSVADAFSPNDDGMNDVLYVHAADLQSLFFAVYDRWGEKVFETDKPANGWDGKYKGRTLDPGVFVYYLKAVCSSGDKEYNMKGNITLFR
ncbi:MAG: gliding motility-associated C-terminal domain-containing protein [Bacteroidetes bacterium]|nr:gliding motility-associated C-terminal domain-containing protein [Bacteroidota bacterium]